MLGIVLAFALFARRAAPDDVFRSCDQPHPDVPQVFTLLERGGDKVLPKEISIRRTLLSVSPGASPVIKQGGALPRWWLRRHHEAS